MIEDLRKNYRYGLAINGVIDSRRNTTYNDYVKYYRTVDVDQFMRQRGGICWDYVRYEADFLEKECPDLSFTTWFVIFDAPPDYPTHTFITIRKNGRVYYIEAAFKQYAGVWKFGSESEAVKFVLDNLSENASMHPEGLFDYGLRIYTFDPLDPDLIGLSDAEYIDTINQVGTRVRKFGRN